MTNKDYRLNARLTWDTGNRLDAMCTLAGKSKSDVVRDLIQNGVVNTTPDQQIVLRQQAQYWDHFNTACLATQKMLDTIGDEVHGLWLNSQDKGTEARNRIEPLCRRLDKTLDDIQKDFKQKRSQTEEEMSNYVRF